MAFVDHTTQPLDTRAASKTLCDAYLKSKQPLKSFLAETPKQNKPSSEYSP